MPIFGDTPQVWIAVPKKLHKKWLAKVRARVAEIVAAEARQITEADEHLFRNPPPRRP